MAPNGVCPECGTASRQRHGWRRRRIEDFPAQGQAVWIELSVCRWRCLNSDCRRRTFSDREAAVATLYARRTSRQAQLLGHMAHAAGGTPAERLLRRLGIRVSDDTILRQLLRAAQVVPPRARIIGIDDWSWRKSQTYGRDIDAVRNAIEMEWSNGQAEGQINRLKTLKRAMYGRAGPNLLRARMLPLHHTN
ncbi:MAG: transposase family protein [Paracoccaceae bacterium]